MAIIVDLPINSMVIFHSYVNLPEGTRPLFLSSFLGPQIDWASLAFIPLWAGLADLRQLGMRTHHSDSGN